MLRLHANLQAEKHRINPQAEKHRGHAVPLLLHLNIALHGSSTSSSYSEPARKRREERERGKGGEEGSGGRGGCLFRASNQLSEHILQTEEEHRLRLQAKPAG